MLLPSQTQAHCFNKLPHCPCSALSLSVTQPCKFYNLLTSFTRGRVILGPPGVVVVNFSDFNISIVIVCPYSVERF